MEGRELLWKAGKTYLAAAELLPVDDEKHVGEYVICVSNDILTQGETRILAIGSRGIIDGRDTAQ